jgi:hypothetical protein
MKITVSRWSDADHAAWRATVPSPPEWSFPPGKSLAIPGVMGSSAPSGPFLEGIGPSPTEAVAALERAVGRAFMYVATARQEGR